MTKNQLKFSLPLVILVSLGFAASPPVALGVPIVNTFGAGDSFDTGFRYGVDSNAEFQAFRFIALTGGVLDRITVALGRIGPETTTVYSLYDGSSSTSLGGLIESFAVPNTVPTSTGAVVSFVSTLKPTLVAGQGYWLSFSGSGPPDGTRTRSIWAFNSIGAQGPRLTHALPAESAALPAFRVEVAEVTAVPEPATIWLAATGLLSLAGTSFLRTRRINNGF